MTLQTMKAVVIDDSWPNLLLLEAMANNIGLEVSSLTLLPKISYDPVS